MRKFFYLSVLGIILVLGIMSCNKSNINPNIPKGVIRIDIDPNSTFYQELNTVGGWTYIDNGQPNAYISGNSRGVIVYRKSLTEFMAYDRMPPNEPDKCCNNNGQCTKLIVGDYYPMVKDTCTQNSYLLLNGSIFTGNGRYPLIQYQAVYDGGLLHIYK